MSNPSSRLVSLNLTITKEARDRLSVIMLDFKFPNLNHAIQSMIDIFYVLNEKIKAGKHDAEQENPN